jgi:hypothetical protein
MKKTIKHYNYLYFITGALFEIVSMLQFADNKTLFGIVYIGLSITFIVLGFTQKTKAK